MSRPTLLAGEMPNATKWSDILSYVPYHVIKTLDTTRTSNATRSADPDLTVAVPANQTFFVVFRLLVTSAANAAGDFQGEVSFPTGATLSWGTSGLADTLASGDVNSVYANFVTRTTGTGNVFNFGASTAGSANFVYATVEVSSTSGSIGLSWAQEVSNASGTTLQDGSSMTVWRVA